MRHRRSAQLGRAWWSPISATLVRLPPVGPPLLLPHHALPRHPPPPVLPSTARRGPNFFPPPFFSPSTSAPENDDAASTPPPSTVYRPPRPWTDLVVTAQGTPATRRCFSSPEPTTPTPSTRHRRSSLLPSSRRRGTPPSSEVLPPGDLERASPRPPLPVSGRGAVPTRRQRRREQAVVA
jgi:hypothetical protein